MNATRQRPCDRTPLLCAAGDTGASLKKRIREVKLPLVAAGIVAGTIPLAIGIIRAQTLPPPPADTYDVVSIHRSNPDQRKVYIGGGPQGGLRLQNVTAMLMLTFAYGIRDYQITGAPAWASSDRFVVSFTPDKGELALVPGISGVKELESVMGRQKQRLQAVLRDRFGLVLRAETHRLPIYALVLAKGGHKLSQPTVTNHGVSLQGGRAQLIADGPGATIEMLAERLAGELGRPVTNETGLDGPFVFKLEWTPDSPAGSPSSPNEPVSVTRGPSIFTALTEQLGLRIESRRGSVPVYVIEKIEKPSEN